MLSGFFAHLFSSIVMIALNLVGRPLKSLRSPEALLVIPLPVVGLEPEPKAHAKHEVWPLGVLQVPGWQLL